MPNALVLGTPSDAHTWNLFYLDLILKESGFNSEVLGGCVNLRDVTKKVGTSYWDIILVSSLNGHFYLESQSVLKSIKKGLGARNPIIVAGGNVDTSNRDINFLERIVKKQGYDEVFFRGDSIKKFQKYCETIFSREQLAC